MTTPINTKIIQLRQKLERMPLRPASLIEYRVFRLKQPLLKMDVFLRETLRDRLVKQADVINYRRRSDLLKVYCDKTRQTLVRKNIDKLKLRRAELLYCSKRSRPIPLHK